MNERHFTILYEICRFVLTEPEQKQFGSHLDYLELFAKSALLCLDLKTLTFEIYPIIEQLYQQKKDNLDDFCQILRIRQIHDSGIMHVEIWRNYLEVQAICQHDQLRAD